MIVSGLIVLWSEEFLKKEKHLAGFDLTDAIKKAPHQEGKVYSIRLVGKLLLEAMGGGKTFH